MGSFDRGYLALGIFIGISLSTALFLWLEWFGFSLTIGNQYFPALLGAIVGGSIAIVGQLLTINHSVSEAEKDKKNSEEAALLSIFVKLNSILDTCSKHYRHQNSDDSRSYIFVGGESAIIKPLSGINEILRFSDTDKAVPLHIKDAELFNMIVDAEGIMESLYYLRKEYDETFLLFEKKLLSQNPTVEGKSIVGEFSFKKTDLLKLSDLRKHLTRLTSDGLPTIQNAHTHIIDVLKKRHGRTINYKSCDEIPGGVFADS